VKNRIIGLLRIGKRTLLPQMVHRLSRTLGGSLFYVLNGAFNDEKRAVLAGNNEHFRGEQNRNHQMFLRRSVHRIEKGLISRPMRKSFAADYIGRTVSTYANLVGGSHFDAGEAQWARDVLARYFVVTAESPDDRVKAARRSWNDARHAETTVDEDLSPFPYSPLNPGLDLYKHLAHVAGNRRSVRWFEQKRVPRALVERAASVGLTAPSACNRQSYRVELLEDDALRRTVAAIPMGTAGFSEQIPLLGVLIGQHRGYEHHRDRHAIYVDGGLFSTGFILALESLGLSTCCINWPEIPALNRKMGRALGLREDERVIMLIAIGYGIEKQEVPRSHKRDLKGLLTWQ
jgi:nitroreductase